MILTLKNISKKFEKQEILKDINFSLEKGEILTILGSSGSGKSTILNLIAGFEKPNSGTIQLGSKEINSKNTFVEPHKRNIGFVFQNYALFPHINVFENIAFGISHEDINKQKRVVDKMIELMRLEGLQKRYPHELSGGQQQRVALARTLATEPELILFDEAFSNIDSILKSRIENELIEIIKDNGLSAIFVTHDAKEALNISDKIAYLEDGKILQLSTPHQMYNCPLSQSVASFFGKANFIEKSSKTYCIRPQMCKADQNFGKIRALIKRVSYLGEKYELEVCFEYENKDYTFTIYVDDSFDVSQEFIYFDIDWERSAMIEQSCKL